MIVGIIQVMIIIFLLIKDKKTQKYYPFLMSTYKCVNFSLKALKQICTKKQIKLAIYEQLCFNLGMKTMPILFTYEDVKDLYPNANGFYSFLKRSLKSGNIKQIKKGLYALVDPSTGRIYASKFQIASKLFVDSYFSYHDALEYYGLATQSFVSRLTYLTHVRVNPIEFEDVVYYSKVSKCELEIVDHIKENGVRVVSLERAIVDSIDNYHLGGGLEEVEFALDSCRKLDIKIIETLLKYYDKAFLYQKVGYLFEKHFGSEVPASFYKFCLSKIGTKKMYLDCTPGRTKLISKWNLIIKDIGGMPDELF